MVKYVAPFTSTKLVTVTSFLLDFNSSVLSKAVKLPPDGS